MYLLSYPGMWALSFDQINWQLEKWNNTDRKKGSNQTTLFWLCFIGHWKDSMAFHLHRNMRFMLDLACLDFAAPSSKNRGACHLWCRNIIARLISDDFFRHFPFARVIMHWSPEIVSLLSHFYSFCFGLFSWLPWQP